MKNKTSDALNEGLAVKDRCYREVAHLPRKAALRKLLVDADCAARSLGLKYTVPDRPMIAAEKQQDYGRRKTVRTRRPKGK